jgi:hypothetical protein
VTIIVVETFVGDPTLALCSGERITSSESSSGVVREAVVLLEQSSNLAFCQHGSMICLTKLESRQVAKRGKGL